MGIKNLRELIKRFSGYSSIYLGELSGSTIAVDSGTFFFSRWAKSYSCVVNKTLLLNEDPDRAAVMERCLELLRLFIRKMQSWNISLIFVLEGTANNAKLITQNKRRAIREKALKDIKEIRDIIAKENDNANSIIDIMDTEQIYLQRLFNRSITIQPEEIKRLVEELVTLKIPTLNAVGEAEQLCAALAREGIVKAAFTSDTDCLVHGCPLILTNIEEEHGLEYFRALYLNKLLSDLDLTFPQFVDVCIMMGCDYNTNIRLIGPIKSYNYIKEYGSIDKLPLPQEKIACLNHTTCREIFRPRSVTELIKP